MVCAPWRAVPEYGVENNDELARECLGFADGNQALIENGATPTKLTMPLPLKRPSYRRSFFVAGFFPRLSRQHLTARAALRPSSLQDG